MAGACQGKNRAQEILSLAQAESYCGVSDTTLRKLVEAKLLRMTQVAPWASLGDPACRPEKQSRYAASSSVCEGPGNSSYGASFRKINRHCFNEINKLTMRG